VEDLLEAQAVEEAGTEEAEVPESDVRPLPARAEPGGVEAWRGEVRTAAIAAGAGVVAGAATVAAVRAVRAVGTTKRGRRALGRRAKDAPQGIIASRSFLVDVHLLGR
jgi:hypothetical protein